MDVKSVLDIANLYGEDILEQACKLALKDFHKITYNTLIPYVKDISKNKKAEKEIIASPPKGIVRGADYYINGGIEQ